MKRMLINATHPEEIRVALVNDQRLYDFDLENRTREQKKSNIYKGRITRVEPSLEAVFVEYGSGRQGFLSLREIAPSYFRADPRQTNNIRDLIVEGTEVIVQIEKEERGTKGAALSTYVSLAGRYLVLMPNNPKGGGISRQITGATRDALKEMMAQLNVPRGMSVIIRTAGIGRTLEELQHDLDQMLGLWRQILDLAGQGPAPMLLHQEAGVVTRAVRDYLRDDIAEVIIDAEAAYQEAGQFVQQHMPQQLDKIRRYTASEPLFARFGVESQIETAYQREVRLPSGGSIVIDQTEALVAIDINSAKATRGSDVEDTAFHTNLEAADEIARQLRLRDMGGLIVIDFIDMSKERNQRAVEQRLRDATASDRARIQFGTLSRFGLMEMSRQRLRPSLEETTGSLCPRCHGTGMIRDLRSIALLIMRQVEEVALRERQGEIQIQVPVELAAFLLNEKREALVYLEHQTRVRVTILPHAHLEIPVFHLHFDRDGSIVASYERMDNQQPEGLGYEADWQTTQVAPTGLQHSNHSEPLGMRESAAQPARQEPIQPAPKSAQSDRKGNQRGARPIASTPQESVVQPASPPSSPTPATPVPAALAWLQNLFIPQQAQISAQVRSAEAAATIEQLVNQHGRLTGWTAPVPTEAMTPAITPTEIVPEAPRSRDERPVREPRVQRENKRDTEQEVPRSRERQSNRTQDEVPVRNRTEGADNSRVTSERPQEAIDQSTSAEERAPTRSRRRTRDDNRERPERSSAREQVDTREVVPALPVRDRQRDERPARGPRYRNPDVLVDQPVTETLVVEPVLSAPVVEESPSVREPVVAPLAPVVPAVVAPAEPVEAAPVETRAFGMPPAAKLPVEANAVIEASEPSVQRASNDPRLQRIAAAPADQSLPDLSCLTTGEFIRQRLGEAGNALLEAGRVAEAFLQALDAQPQTPTVATPIVDESTGSQAEQFIVAPAFGSRPVVGQEEQTVETSNPDETAPVSSESVVTIDEQSFSVDTPVISEIRVSNDPRHGAMDNTSTAHDIAPIAAGVFGQPRQGTAIQADVTSLSDAPPAPESSQPNDPEFAPTFTTAAPVVEAVSAPVGNLPDASTSATSWPAPEVELIEAPAPAPVPPVVEVTIAAPAEAPSEVTPADVTQQEASPAMNEPRVASVLAADQPISESPVETQASDAALTLAVKPEADVQQPQADPATPVVQANEAETGSNQDSDAPGVEDADAHEDASAETSSESTGHDVDFEGEPDDGKPKPKRRTVSRRPPKKRPA